MDIFTWRDTPSGILIMSYDTFKINVGVRKLRPPSWKKVNSSSLPGETIPEEELDEASSPPLVSDTENHTLFIIYLATPSY